MGEDIHKVEAVGEITGSYGLIFHLFFVLHSKFDYKNYPINVNLC